MSMQGYTGLSRRIRKENDLKDLDLSFVAIEDAIEVFPIMNAVYEAVKDLDHIQLMAILAAVIDEWAARHELTQKETFEILEMLAAVQKQVHEDIGPASGGTEKAPDKHEA